MDLLFSRVSIFDVLAQREEQLKTEVGELDASVFERVSEEEILHGLTVKYKFEIPVLEEDKAYISHREVNVDVSRDPMRIVFDRSKPFYIKGTEIKFSVPFKGDPSVFSIRPSTYSLNPPRGEIRGREIELVYTRTDENAAALRADYQKALNDIKQHLGWLQSSIGEFNKTIGQRVDTLLSQRRDKLNASASMVNAIGLPVKQAKATGVSTNVPRSTALNKSLASPKKWDVFISHASEDKDDLVRPLAKELETRGLSVWYDEFSLRIGDSLRASIDYGLLNSRYGVVVLSKDFFTKHWPQQELNGLTTREVGGRTVILPIWHKVTFEEVRAFSPTLADKVAVRSEQGLETIVANISQAVEQV